MAQISINQDKEFVKMFRESLKENDGYCPCKVEKTEDTKCMCTEFRQQKRGYCHCGLYFKTDIDCQELELNDKN